MDTQPHAVITPSPRVNVTYVSAVKLPMAPGTVPLRALDPRLTALQVKGIGEFDIHRPRHRQVSTHHTPHHMRRSALVGEEVLPHG